MADSTRTRRLIRKSEHLLELFEQHGLVPYGGFSFETEAYTLEVHGSGDRTAVFVDGEFVDGDPEYAQFVREIQEKTDD